MKLNCGPTREEIREQRAADALARKIRRRQWHRWFAWHPVRVGKRDCRWLEVVERREYTEEVVIQQGLYVSCVRVLDPVWQYRPCP